MKKILKIHGLAALILGILLAAVYLWFVRSGGDIGDAVTAVLLYMILGGAFLLDLFLFLVNTILYHASPENKILISRILLFLYAAGLLYTVYSAFTYSYGSFFAWLAEGDVFCYLYLFVILVLIIMIIVRMRELKKMHMSRQAL